MRPGSLIRSRPLWWEHLLRGLALTYAPQSWNTGPEAMAEDWRAIGEDLYAAMVDAAAPHDGLRKQLAEEAGAKHDRLMALVPEAGDDEELRRNIIGAARQQKKFQTALLAAGAQEPAA